MKYIDKKGNLEDKRIIAAIKIAADDYENGAIIEARDELSDVIAAIDQFTELEG